MSSIERIRVSYVFKIRIVESATGLTISESNENHIDRKKNLIIYLIKYIYIPKEAFGPVKNGRVNIWFIDWDFSIRS